MDVFKIKNNDGLFSNGDAGKTSWNKSGKVWMSMGKLRTHLYALYHRDKLSIYNDCTIVKYELVERELTNLNETLYQVNIRGFYEEFKSSKSNYGGNR